MKTENFDKVIEKALSSSREVLIEKAKEYAKNDNRLHNFEKAARMSGNTREECLWGFALKHLVSVTDIIEGMSKDECYVPKQELVREKIGDSINYLLLLEACIEDRRNTQKLPF